MTKQEYEAALKYAMDTYRQPWRDIAIHQANNNYIASLGAEIAQLKNRNTELKEIIDRIYDISMKKDHEFGLTWQFANDIVKQKAEIDMLKQENANLKDEIAQLQADNCSLVEQINGMDMKQNQED